MADRDPADQQINRDDAGSEIKRGGPRKIPAWKIRIDKAEDNQSEVQLDDYPEKAGDVHCEGLEQCMA